MSTRREYGRFDGDTPIYCGMCGYDGADGWLVDAQGIECPLCLALVIARSNRTPDGVTAEAKALIEALFARKDSKDHDE
jgi:hypothetical protein